MRVALVSEGTYPFGLGGVSTWCDQLIRGLPEFRWDMVALTVDGSERPIWPAPDNLDRLLEIPLWSPSPAGPARSGRLGGRRGARAASRAGSAFASSYDALLASMLAPHDTRSDQAMVARSRFLLALRGIFEFASDGGDLHAAMTSNAAVNQLIGHWEEIRESELSVADALEAANLMAHMLRPLTVEPVRCDIVHASMNGLSMLVAMAAKWRYGTPVVMSEQGIYLRERYLAYLDEKTTPWAVRVLLLSFFRALAGASYLISDALAPHSSYNRRWQLQNGADPDRMWTMYNGVQLDDFPLAESEPDRPTVVFMGRINPLKDLHTLIRAFSYVRVAVPEAQLRIFGATPPGDQQYERSCRRLINDLRLRGAVVMEGRVESPVVAYHAASVVALTSVSEGFPVAVVEAMACGLPIVCTNVGGVSEAVADAGIVVPPRDHVAVAKALITLLRDDELRRRMAQSARSRVQHMFELGDSLQAYRRVYDTLTDGPAVAHTDVAPRPPRLSAQPAPPALPRRVPRTRPAGLALGCRPRAVGRVRVGAGGHR